MESLAGNAKQAPSCTILARFHSYQIDYQQSAERMADFAAKQKAENAFILADSHRLYIALALEKRGVIPVFPDGIEMQNEWDRTPERLIEFCNDWKTAIAAPLVINAVGVSSLLYPSLAAGRAVITL
jgi:hypothetical protein